MSNQPLADTIPPSRFPRHFGDVYVLRSQLGRGGMGICYLADEYVSTSRERKIRSVVIKVVPPDVQDAEDEMAKVEDMFNKTHILGHTNICPVHSLKQDSRSGYYLVMKYIDGVTLNKYRRELFRRNGKVTLDDAVKIFKPLAAALDFSHSKRIIHRDVKPTNVMIAAEDGTPFLIDFGLAAQIRSSTTRVSNAVTSMSGSIFYKAPEQWEGEAQKEQTDQYSLAVMLYEFLSGEVPFMSDDTEILYRLVTQKPVRPLENFSAGVNAALAKALAKERKERFNTCTEFIEALTPPPLPTKPLPLPPIVIPPKPQAPNVESLMKQGYSCLKDSDWKQANEYFDRALGIAPKYAAAYIGKLCANLKVSHEEQLGDFKTPIADYDLFQKAIRFADNAYKSKIAGYDKKIRNRRWLDQRRMKRESDFSPVGCFLLLLILLFVLPYSFAYFFMSPELIPLSYRFQTEEEVEMEKRQNEVEAEKKAYITEKQAGERMLLMIKGVEYPFRWCPPGTFTMGSPSYEPERGDNETPHQVTLTQGFWMLETPVTQTMWASVMGSNPSYFKGGQFPVERVSWSDCREYIEKLNALGILPEGFRFSLPTEAQWEYACRAGTTTPFHFGDSLNGDKANCRGDHPYGASTKGRYLKRTTDAGTYSANDWGLCDMHGQVWEWCSDLYGVYPVGSVIDPTGPYTGSLRVVRGGSWTNDALLCRSASRNYSALEYRRNGLGLRLHLVGAQ